MQALHACRPWCSSGGRLAAMPSRRRRLGATCCEGAMDRRAAGLYAAFLACRRRRRAAMPDIVAPGVYVEETGAGAHVIAGVPTSVAAFVGATASGSVAVPRIVHSFAEFEAQFGALAAEMPLGYAVQQYFVNGGRDALIARIVPSGPTLTDADLSSPALEAQKRGLWLLDHAERFNILCIPPLARTTDVGRATWDAAAAYAVRRRAMVIVDPPAAWTAAPTMSAVAALLTRSPNAALYYARLQAADPLRGNQIASFAPCGAVAGIYARTDASRGVWKAPAGAQANVLGVAGLSATLSDAQLSALNAMGVNGLRALSGAVVLWGARTLAGDDVADPFKFVPLRRLDLFIEDSITRGLQGATLRAERPIAVGAHPHERCGFPARSVPARRVPGRQAGGSVFRALRRLDHDAAGRRSGYRQAGGGICAASARRIRHHRHRHPGQGSAVPELRVAALSHPRRALRVARHVGWRGDRGRAPRAWAWPAHRTGERSRRRRSECVARHRGPDEVRTGDARARHHPRRRLRKMGASDAAGRSAAAAQGCADRAPRWRTAAHGRLGAQGSVAG